MRAWSHEKLPPRGFGMQKTPGHVARATRRNMDGCCVDTARHGAGRDCRLPDARHGSCRLDRLGVRTGVGGQERSGGLIGNGRTLWRHQRFRMPRPFAAERGTWAAGAVSRWTYPAGVAELRFGPARLCPKVVWSGMAGRRWHGRRCTREGRRSWRSAPRGGLEACPRLSLVFQTTCPGGAVGLSGWRIGNLDTVPKRAPCALPRGWWYKACLAHAAHHSRAVDA